MIKVCLDYNIETNEIIKAITLVEIKPELLSLLSQVHTYGYECSEIY